VKSTLKIFTLTIAVTAFYYYVGQQVPQKETYPPEEVEIGSDLSTEEMVAIGQEIVAGKGTCLSCHTMGQEGALRFPDLGNIGAIAGTRKPDLSDVEYLAESLYEPSAYIVEGFLAGMPAIGRPPIGLTDDEILTVIAYLQSLGGTPTVTMATELPGQGQSPDPVAGGTAPVATAASSGLDGPGLAQLYLCTTCHNLEADVPGAGPSLYDVGSRLSRGEIYEAIMAPDDTVAEGYAPGVMPAMLNVGGFYDKISTQDLKTLVDHLASLKGT
jgi:mono/diheme cytochrome c family protein